MKPRAQVFSRTVCLLTGAYCSAFGAFLFVRRYASTVAALGRAPAGSTYDIVDDRAVSMSEFAEMLAQAAGARRPFAIPASAATPADAVRSADGRVAPATVQPEGARRARLATVVPEIRDGLTGSACN